MVCAPHAEGRVGGVIHDAQPLQPGYDLAQHLDALGRHLLAERRKAGQASAGPRQALEKIGIALHGRQRHRDDGDGCPLDDGARRGRARRQQHIHGPCNEGVDQCKPSANVAAGRLRIDDDGPAFDMAELGHRFTERNERRGVNLRRRKTDKPYDGDTLRLGGRGRWPGRCAQNSQKLSPPQLTAPLSSKSNLITPGGPVPAAMPFEPAGIRRYPHVAVLMRATMAIRSPPRRGRA
jgi:hypothetical protein